MKNKILVFIFIKIKINKNNMIVVTKKMLYDKVIHEFDKYNKAIVCSHNLDLLVS